MEYVIMGFLDSAGGLGALGTATAAVTDARSVDLQQQRQEQLIKDEQQQYAMNQQKMAADVEAQKKVAELSKGIVNRGTAEGRIQTAQQYYSLAAQIGAMGRTQEADNFRKIGDDYEKMGKDEQAEQLKDQQDKQNKIGNAAIAYTQNPTSENWDAFKATQPIETLSKIPTDAEGKLNYAKAKEMEGMNNKDRNEFMLQKLKAAEQIKKYEADLAKSKLQDDLIRANIAQKKEGLNDGKMSEEEKLSIGAEGKTGKPWTQIISGYGKDAARKREVGRNEAIRQIMEDEGIDAKQAGVELAKRTIKYKASSGAYSAIEKRAAGIEYSSEKIKSDIQLMDTVIDKAAAKGGAKLLNTPLNAIRKEFSDPELGKMRLVTHQVALEYEKAMLGGTLSIAQLSVEGQIAAQKLLNEDMTIGEIREKLPLLIKEIDNAKKASIGVKSDLLSNVGKPKNQIDHPADIKDIMSKYKKSGG